MLINKTALVAAAVMVFGVSSAWAADSTSTQINISATVPSTAFYAQASSPTFGQAEVMGYDIGQNKINSLRENFTYKSTGGALRAYIDGGPRALFNGNTAHNIPQTTKFNGVTLTAAALEVATAPASAAGGTAELEVSAGAIPTGASGNFSTAFTVMFDSTPPTP